MVLATTPPNHRAIDALTPPPSGSKAPSPVHTVLTLLRRLNCGLKVSCGPWTSIRLPASGYEEFNRQVNADSSLKSFVNDKARFDYDKHLQKLTLRMPTTVHETFIELVVEDILFQLRNLGSGSGPSADFARSIKPLGSSRIVFKNDLESDPVSTTASGETYIRREPDASFAHKRAKYPAVVIEVSYSQKRTCLNGLAEEYILQSNGNIRVVLGLDIEYRGSKKATISLWCPQTIADEEDGQPVLVAHSQIEGQLFRNEDGTANEDVSLSIPLSSFAPNKISRTQSFKGEEITLSSITLCRYLETAEGRSLAEKDGVEDSPPARRRKRRRLETSPEQLTVEDEAAFLAREEDSIKKATRDDSSFKASSSQESH